MTKKKNEELDKTPMKSGYPEEIVDTQDGSAAPSDKEIDIITESLVEPLGYLIGGKPIASVLLGRFERRLKELQKQALSRRRLFEEVLRRWIRIDVKRAKRLQGGVSGAAVYRIWVEILIPSLQVSFSKLVLPSLILKINTKESFKRERARYNSLPPILKERFAGIESPLEPIMQESNGQSKVFYYMIVEDLIGYKPLHDMLHEENHETNYIDGLVNEVWKALVMIYNYRKHMPIVGLRSSSLYIGAIQKTIEAAARRHKKIENMTKQKLKTQNGELQPINHYLERILSNSRKFEPKFLTYMHGDLHARNIMVKESKDLKFDIKLLDIDRQSKNGDYIYDVGELIADLETIGPLLFAKKEEGRQEKLLSYKLEAPETAAATGKIILEKVEEFVDTQKGKTEDDRHWKNRLCLAKARALFSFIRTAEEAEAMILYREGLNELKKSLEI